MSEPGDCLPAVIADAAASEEHCAFLAVRLQLLIASGSWDACPHLKAARERARRAAVELNELALCVRRHYAGRRTTT